MKYNKDEKIKVGDLVRVVNPIYKQDDGFEFIVSRIDEDGGIWGPEELFFAKELEIMLPADQVELKEVMDEQQDRIDKGLELLDFAELAYNHLYNRPDTIGGSEIHAEMAIKFMGKALEIAGR